MIDFDAKDAVLEKHSVTISGHRTSISLEKLFWDHLKTFAKQDQITIADLIRQIDEARGGSLSGALRVYVLRRLLQKT